MVLMRRITPSLRWLEPNRMPGSFHFDSVENPIWIFRFSTEVVSDGAADVTFHIDGSAGLQFSANPFVVAGIDYGIDIHVTGEMRRELAAIARKQIEDAGRKIARRHDFG